MTEILGSNKCWDCANERKLHTICFSDFGTLNKHLQQGAKMEARLTQKELIVKFLEAQGNWIPAYALRGRQTLIGFLGHQADRRARELAAEGKIQHKLNGKYAYYKALERQK